MQTEFLDNWDPLYTSIVFIGGNTTTQNRGSTTPSPTAGDAVEMCGTTHTWSPDSKYVAVLSRDSSGKLKSPMDILSATFGHPVQYSNYWIEVIGVDGKNLGRAQIASNVRASWGEIVWTQ